MLRDRLIEDLILPFCSGQWSNEELADKIISLIAEVVPEKEKGNSGYSMTFIEGYNSCRAKMMEAINGTRI